jgi:hypothetical protein
VGDSIRQLTEGVDASELISLRRQIVGLEQELDQAKDEAAQAKQTSADAVKAIRALRKTLDPWYTALKMIYGEISRVEVDAMDDSAPPSHTGSDSGGLSPKWQMMKQKLGGRQAEIIEVLKHGAMTVAQIRAAVKCDIGVAYKLTKKMQDLGLLVKNGSQYALKDL